MREWRKEGDIEAEHLPARAGDIKHSLADISHAKKMIGYTPLVYFDKGLERAIDWYTDNLLPRHRD